MHMYSTDPDVLAATDTRWMVLDLECSIHSGFKRKGNPFLRLGDYTDYANGIYYIGYRRYTDTENQVAFTTQRPGLGRSLPRGLLDGIDVLVGFNLCGYDLMFYWDDPEFLAFLLRGGRVHDCQYAEYLLRAQHQKFHMASLNTVAPMYGGEVKLDAVAACWEQGIDTPDIPQELMLEYLIGTDKQGGDIGNTLKVYLGQVQNLHKLGMYKAWLLRMDGMLCTSQMMYNGVKVDMDTAEEQLKELTDEFAALQQALMDSLPDDLPPELEWRWTNFQKSAILFGGTLKYKKRMPILDELGQQVYTKATEPRHLWNGRPVPPDLMLTDKPGFFYSPKTQQEYECDKFMSGKRIGEYKTKNVPVQGTPKSRLEDVTYTFQRLVDPLPEWETKNVDAAGAPVYSTGEDTIDALASAELPFIKQFVRYSALIKEIGTYYRGTDKSGNPAGMLTLVQPWDSIIHHSLNHTSVVTTRLSSSSPNMQNIPRKDKSKVKRMFVSRFGSSGLMGEIDYSQLEVVGQGVLSKDTQLREDLRNRVDFHCKRVALVYGCTYEEALLWCKDESYPDHALWKGRRTKCKVFSFQR